MDSNYPPPPRPLSLPATSPRSGTPNQVITANLAVTPQDGLDSMAANGISLSKLVHNLESRVTRLESEKQDLETELRSSASALHGKEQEIADLRDALSRAGFSKAHELRAKEKQIADLEKQVKHAAGNVHPTLQANKRPIKENNSNGASVTALPGGFAKLQQQVGEITEEMRQLRDENAKLKNGISALPDPDHRPGDQEPMDSEVPELTTTLADIGNAMAIARVREFGFPSFAKNPHRFGRDPKGTNLKFGVHDFGAGFRKWLERSPPLEEETTPAECIGRAGHTWVLSSIEDRVSTPEWPKDPDYGPEMETTESVKQTGERDTVGNVNEETVVHNDPGQTMRGDAKKKHHDWKAFHPKQESTDAVIKQERQDSPVVQNYDDGRLHGLPPAPVFQPLPEPIVPGSAHSRMPFHPAQRILAPAAGTHQPPAMTPHTKPIVHLGPRSTTIPQQPRAMLPQDKSVVKLPQTFAAVNQPRHAQTLNGNMNMQMPPPQQPLRQRLQATPAPMQVQASPSAAPKGKKRRASLTNEDRYAMGRSAV